jgi:hypothetical protein
LGFCGKVFFNSFVFLRISDASAFAQVGIDSDAKGPAAGKTMVVRDIGSLARDEGGKAFHQAGATLIGDGSVGGVLIHGRII